MKNIPGNIFLVIVLFVLTAAGCNDGSTNPSVDEVKITQITDYPSGIGMVNIAHDGSFIVYAVRNDTITQVIKSDIYGGNKKVIMTFPSLYYILLSKDDSKILYGNVNSSYQFDYYLQDLNTGAFFELISFDLNQNPHYYPVAFTNDNKGILFGSSHIYLLDIETKTIKKVIDEFAIPIAFSPSGNLILFSSGSDDKLYKVNIDGSSRMALAGEYSVYKALYSPDGNHIYFSGRKKPDIIKSSIWKMNANGSNITMTAGGKDNYGLSSISHDGRTLLLHSHQENSTDGYTNIIIKTANYQKKLTELANNDYGLSFTNQPGKILFIRSNMYISNIFLAEFPVAWLGNFTP